MKKLSLLIVLVLGVTAVYGQDFLTKSKVSGSFQMDGNYYWEDQGIGITSEEINGNQFGAYGFGKLQYQLGNFTAGMRFEAYQITPMSGFDMRVEGMGVANFFATYDDGTIGVTVGDIYDQFGNGLVFRSYEEWTLGFDNALRGIRAVFRPWNGVTLKGVYGKQRFYWASYSDNDYSADDRGYVRGIDGEWDLNQSINSLNDSKLRATLGGSFVSKFETGQSIYVGNDELIMPRNVASYAGRFNLGYGRFTLSTEYARKINDPSYFNNYIYREGQELLASLSYSQRGLGVVMQVKRVDNMSFKSSRYATQNDLDIGFIPPLNYTHTHSLPSMFSYATQPLGEMGMQFQVNYTIPKNTALGGKYGTKLAFNFSQVNDIKRDSIMVDGVQTINQPGTLGYSSDFFAIGDRMFYRDMNFEIEKKINAKWHLTLMYINLYYDMETIENHPGSKAVNANFAFGEVIYKINRKHSIRMELQHMWDNVGPNETIDIEHSDYYKKRGNWFAFLLEYTIAPKWFVSVADKYNYGNPLADNRDHYVTGSFGYIKDQTRIAISGGRQSEGLICVGGVCRAVPASSGLSLTITTSF
ncbi:MAG: hypothetical protein J6X10_08655 [Bacteroidales bacterium]|nr:hypothetical protein [Bacteroidales bacterium]